jgi:hypothetical protein
MRRGGQGGGIEEEKGVLFMYIRWRAIKFEYKNNK